MSYVVAAPEMMTSAASDLARIESALSAAHAAAATQTTAVLAAAEDEVSARTRSITAMTAASSGSSPSARSAWASALMVPPDRHRAGRATERPATSMTGRSVG
jgi:hypothetical protein